MTIQLREVVNIVNVFFTSTENIKNRSQLASSLRKEKTRLYQKKKLVFTKRKKLVFASEARQSHE